MVLIAFQKPPITKTNIGIPIQTEYSRIFSNAKYEVVANEDNLTFGFLLDQFDDQKILGNPENDPPWDEKKIRIEFVYLPGSFEPGQWVDGIDDKLDIINAQWLFAGIFVCGTREQETWVLPCIG